ncbi:MAG: DUF4416 family protein [candidate division WOR-3 bacterium]|nr:DUF4416 family protein [candidate division WOR-3 bacterium]
MTTTNNHIPFGLIVWGIITQDISLISTTEKILYHNYGEIVIRSPIIPFDFTDYYEKEMGKNLQRCWIVTKKFISVERLVEIKKYAEQIEKKFLTEENKRRINIDPGILTLQNFILTTHKNYGHRIYLKEGVFAEVTLIYRQHSYQPLEWTYPDYRKAIEFFNECRKLLRQLQT